MNVLNSLQTLQNLQLEELRGEKAVLANRVALYLALGGNWTNDLEMENFQALNYLENNNGEEE